MYLLFNALLPADVKFWYYTFCADVFASLTNGRSFIAPALDFASAAVQTRRLFDIHSASSLRS